MKPGGGQPPPGPCEPDPARAVRRSGPGLRHYLAMTGRLGGLRAAALLVATMPALAAGLAGCGSKTVAGPLDNNRPLSAPASVSPPPQGHRFGESVPANTGFIAAAVFGYRQPVSADASPPPAGAAWAAADVQACAQPGTVFQVTISDAPWSLRLSDGTAVPPSHTDDPHFPQPRYPTTPTALQPGECLRGSLVFAVPAGAQAQTLWYSPQGGAPIDWVVP